MEKKETLFVAFSTQKGGMGKTAMTVLTASYLHYVKGYHVAVIDCDFPQQSIVKERNRDYDLIINDMYFKRAAYDQLWIIFLLLSAPTVLQWKVHFNLRL